MKTETIISFKNDYAEMVTAMEAMLEQEIKHCEKLLTYNTHDYPMVPLFIQRSKNWISHLTDRIKEYKQYADRFK